MTETLLALVPVHGLWLLALATFLSCLALPIPSSVLMLAAGGFAAAGDLQLWAVVAVAVGGAVVGDQLGYVIGRRGGAALLDRLERDPRRGAVLARARDLMRRRGGLAVFLSRWLFSPLGPYVNLMAGAARQPRLAFTLWSLSGEALWCGLYVLAGHAFAGNLAAASDMLGSVLGLVASGTAAAALGWALWSAARRHGH